MRLPEYREERFWRLDEILQVEVQTGLLSNTKWGLLQTIARFEETEEIEKEKILNSRL